MILIKSRVRNKLFNSPFIMKTTIYGLINNYFICNISNSSNILN